MTVHRRLRVYILNRLCNFPRRLHSPAPRNNFSKNSRHRGKETHLLGVEEYLGVFLTDPCLPAGTVVATVASSHAAHKLIVSTLYLSFCVWYLPLRFNAADIFTIASPNTSIDIHHQSAHNHCLAFNFRKKENRKKN